MKKNIERNLKKIEIKENVAIDKGLKTVGFGILLKGIVAFIGFLVGTYFYSEESAFYLKVDEFFEITGNIIFMLVLAVAMVFAVRLFKLKNQKEILKSIQTKKIAS